ncbi:hypothetical protein FEM48_Zijuj08G0145900 [Ziziphus jujuba var. spinosa]|uniref:CCHC-type domain-containing protein n=1 Tax=Ziziphus jujuba var. spinosa TaxID=714518 RepID=A0A978UZP1_ZIZJJ|nr:hypothetical protein FEM48_Zijuj08G0145900 [Ziziphus jujuba var. spinosa]
MKADRDRVWFQRPWTINGAHMCLKKWNPHMSLRDFDFSSSTFWVQIHGLPLQFLNKENACKIGVLLKEVIRCEDSSRKNLLGLKYLRIQVEVHISKPLLTGFFQKIGSNRTWIQFCYERRRDFCYKCGVIGHLKNSCKSSTNNLSQTEGDEYGVWLRAEEGAFSVVSSGSHLRRIENPRRDFFDSWSNEELGVVEMNPPSDQGKASIVKARADLQTSAVEHASAPDSKAQPSSRTVLEGLITVHSRG